MLIGVKRTSRLIPYGEGGEVIDNVFIASTHLRYIFSSLYKHDTQPVHYKSIRNSNTLIDEVEDYLAPLPQGGEGEGISRIR